MEKNWIKTSSDVLSGVIIMTLMTAGICALGGLLIIAVRFLLSQILGR